MASKPARASGTQELVVGLTAVTPVVGPFLPIVFGLVGTLSRTALKDDQREAITTCLEDAFADDAARKLPSRWRHPLQRRSSRRERKAEACRAAEDVLTHGLPMYKEEVERENTTDDVMPMPPARPRLLKRYTSWLKIVSGRSGRSSGRRATAGTGTAAASRNGNDAELLEQFATLAKRQVAEVLAPTRFIPWPSRVAAALTFAVNASWDDLKEKGTDEQRLKAAQLIVGTDDANAVGRVNDWTLQAFGERVGRGFEANMARHDKLEFLVQRLDKHDELLGQQAMIEAAQGIRVAGFFAVAVGAAGVLAVVEIAVHAFF